MLTYQLLRFSDGVAEKSYVLFDAPLVPMHKLYLSLCITIIVSTGTFWSTIWSTPKTTLLSIDNCRHPRYH